MGLDTTHDAFHGAYSAFNRFRQAACEALGGSFPPHSNLERLKAIGVTEEPRRDWWYVPDEVTRETHPGMYFFLEHEDCDGIIPPEMCGLIAEEMERLLPRLDEMGEDVGHIAAAGGIGAVARRFIKGCRLAAKRNEKITFH